MFKYLLQFQMSEIPCYVEHKMQRIYSELVSEILFNLCLVLFPSLPLHYKKSLQLSVLLFFFFTSFSSVFQKQTEKSFLANVLPFVTQEACDQD